MTRPVRTAFVRSSLAAALALAVLPAIAQSYDNPYSQTVVFGDSLSDSGAFRPALVQVAGPDAAILGRFTTNPGLIWVEYLADFYGTGASPAGQGGSNYAVGGARSGTDAVTALAPGVDVPVPSVASQVQGYLAAAGGADPNALYTMWAGNNDVFAAVATASAGGDPVPVIAGAVAAQIGAIGALQASGARYVLVPSIPDIGLTPGFRAQGEAAMAAGTQLSAAYNQALYGGLTQAGLRVIPLDTFHLFQEVVADPDVFGFSNVTGTACQPQITAQSLTCNPGTYVSPDAPQSYAFADGVHPTAGAHEVVADYAASVLEAPRRMAVLTNSASMTGRARAERVAAHVGARPESDGMRWWTDLSGNFQRYDSGNFYDGAGPALTLGVDWATGDLVFGAFAGYGTQELDWGHRGGSFDQNEATVGGFVGWYGESAWVNGQLGYSQLDYDIDRRVELGRGERVHHGETDGDTLSAGVSGGVWFGDGALRHGPVVGVLAQRIQIDGFAESDPQLSTSLAYPEQEFESLIGSAGWQAEYTLGAHLQPYARVTWDREFEDRPEQAFASLQSMPGTLPYAVPGIAFDQEYGTATFGVRMRLFGLDANVGASATAADNGGNHASVFATVGGSF